MFKIGVVAGTPVDVEFGIKFLRNKGYLSKAIPISNNPVEQTIFQTLTTNKREKELIHILENSEDCDLFLFYCNSLSSTVNIEKISRIIGKEIITPLGAYKEVKTLNNVGIISANAQSLSMIESIIYQSMPCKTICMSNLLIVEAIEKNDNPDQIINQYGIDIYIELCNRNNVDRLILGCTHFDYLEDSIQKIISNKGYNIEILTPKKYMYLKLEQIIGNLERVYK